MQVAIHLVPLVSTNTSHWATTTIFCTAQGGQLVARPDATSETDLDILFSQECSD